MASLKVRHLLAGLAALASIVLVSLGIPFIGLLYMLPEHATCYEVLKRYRDEHTGLFVEMGRYSNLSALGLLVQVFEDDAARTTTSSSWPPAIVEIANIRWDLDVDLSYVDGCYVVTARYGWGGLATPTWRDPRTGEELCFRLKPTSGPVGGWKP